MTLKKLFLISVLVAIGSCVSMECYLSASQLGVHLNEQLKTPTYESVKRALKDRHNIRQMSETIKLCGGNKTSYNVQAVTQCNQNLIDGYDQLHTLNHSIDGLSFTESLLKFIILSNDVSRILNNTQDSCKETVMLARKIYFRISGRSDPLDNQNLELLQKKKKDKKDKKEKKEDKEESNEYSKYYKDYYSQGLLSTQNENFIIPIQNVRKLDPICEQAAILSNQYCIINLCQQLNKNDCEQFCQDEFDSWIQDCLI